MNTVDKALWDRARQLYVQHMRSQGHGGDNWDRLDASTRQLWLDRAAKERK